MKLEGKRRLLGWFIVMLWPVGILTGSGFALKLILPPGGRLDFGCWCLVLSGICWSVIGAGVTRYHLLARLWEAESSISQVEVESEVESESIPELEPVGTD